MNKDKKLDVIHWLRLRWDLTHLLSRRVNYYYKGKPNRNAREDITHAVVNMPVEWARAAPYAAGHWFFYSIVLNLVLAGGIVWLFH